MHGSKRTDLKNGLLLDLSNQCLFWKMDFRTAFRLLKKGGLFWYVLIIDVTKFIGYFHPLNSTVTYSFLIEYRMTDTANNDYDIFSCFLGDRINVSSSKRPFNYKHTAKVLCTKSGHNVQSGTSFLSINCALALESSNWLYLLSEDIKCIKMFLGLLGAWILDVKPAESGFYLLWLAAC